MILYKKAQRGTIAENKLKQPSDSLEIQRIGKALLSVGKGIIEREIPPVEAPPSSGFITPPNNYNSNNDQGFQQLLKREKNKDYMLRQQKSSNRK